MASEIPIKAKGDADFSNIEAAFSRINRMAGTLNSELAKIPKALGSIASSSLTQLQQLGAGSLSGGAMYGRIAGGLQSYKDHVIALDNEARSVKALGEAYTEYRRRVIDAGRNYGFDNDSVVGLASQLNRANGRAGAGQLTDTMRLAQGFSRGYGMSLDEGGGIFAGAARQGITSGGGDTSPRQFAALIAEAVAGGGMGGREREVVGSIQDLSRSMNRQLVTVQGTQLATSLLTTLNQTGIRGLQGQEGAGLLGQMNQAIMNPGGGEAGDLFLYRALQGGQNTGMGLGDYRYLQEQGLSGVGPSGKSNLQAMMEGVHGLGLSAKYRLMAGSQLTGLSMHQYEAMENTFMKDGTFQTAKMGALEERLGPKGLQNVDASTWGMLAELTQKPNDAATTGAVAKEFAQLSGQKAVSTTDSTALFSQIQQYGQGNVAMSAGQEREKLDSDLSKAAEDAGAKLYDLRTAADQAALALLKIGGEMPGPLGGIAPIALGSMAGSLLTKGGSLLTKGGGQLLSKLPGMGWLGGGSGAAAGAEGAAAAGAEGAAAVGGTGILGGATAFLGGALAGVGTAGIASSFSRNVLGTRYGITDAIGFADQADRELAQKLYSGELFGREGWETAKATGNATGAVVTSVPAAAAGLIRGSYNALTGGSFQQGYNDVFFGVNQFDSPGRQQWVASKEAQGIHADPVIKFMSQIKRGEVSGTLLGLRLQQMGDPSLATFADKLLGGGDVDTTQVLAAISQATGKPIPSSRGGWWDVPTDEQPALLHRKEMVLPANLAEALRQTVASNQHGGGGSGSMRVSIDPIVIQMPDGTRQTVQPRARMDPYGGIITQPFRGAD